MVKLAFCYIATMNVAKFASFNVVG